MQLSCLKCNTKVALDAVACPACGTKVDADGNGVPDALEKMVEDKARALLASEKQREQNEQAQAARVEADAKKAQERIDDEKQLQWEKAKLEENEAEPRKKWHFTKLIATIFAIASLVIGGIMFPACAEPMADHSLFAAKVFCPAVCPTCRGPGRIWTWHETSASYEGNVSRQLCHNDVVDIDKINWTDSDNKENEPYRLTLWASVPLDWGFIFILMCAVGPFLTARMRNSYLNDGLSARRQKILELEQKLAPRAAPKEPYR